MNGPAALKVSKGDKIIIIAYASIGIRTAKTFNPGIIFPGKSNSIKEVHQSLV
jgi:aspartate 1-decarboxylase